MPRVSSTKRLVALSPCTPVPGVLVPLLVLGLLLPTTSHMHACMHTRRCLPAQLARERRLMTGPVAVVVPLSTFGSWEREMAK